MPAMDVATLDAHLGSIKRYYEHRIAQLELQLEKCRRGECTAVAAQRTIVPHRGPTVAGSAQHDGSTFTGRGGDATSSSIASRGSPTTIEMPPQPPRSHSGRGTVDGRHHSLPSPMAASFFSVSADDYFQATLQEIRSGMRLSPNGTTHR